MGLDLEYIDGQTPIDEDEKEGLLIETIATKEELDEFEQQNIEESIQWIFGKKFNAKDVFTNKTIFKHLQSYPQFLNSSAERRETDALPCAYDGHNVRFLRIVYMDLLH